IAFAGGGFGTRLDGAPRPPVLLHLGETDPALPLPVAGAVPQRHPGAITHLYPAGHGFNCDERASYDAASATLAKRRTLGLLQAVF
ncbi:dienelactone hydrolase family protein, partial [Azospirillum brasilense]|nr:dienelactone hydrolase family protein [Azospirillum brasilense]